MIAHFSRVLALAAALLPSAAAAQGEGAVAIDGPFTYSVFEFTVEHADLATCPPGIDDRLHFCRLTLAAESLHVFVFALDGDQPLVAVHSYPLEGAGLPF
jgi:hypothetical protein